LTGGITELLLVVEGNYSHRLVDVCLTDIVFLDELMIHNLESSAESFESLYIVKYECHLVPISHVITSKEAALLGLTRLEKTVGRIEPAAKHQLGQSSDNQYLRI
jgi:hypothetical protein